MTRPLLAAVGALAALALAAPAAHADCPRHPLERTFLPWLDPAYYHPAPDGGFEAGDAWTLTGAAAIVDGNQPYLPGAKSLDLPPGSAATTAPICVNVAHPTIRFYARNVGSPLSPLVVTVKFRTLLGVTVELPAGAVVGGASWQPTLPLPVVGNLLSNEVRFRLTPSAGSAWQVDDVYVDPYSKG
jgi:hypothetical protein